MAGGDPERGDSPTTTASLSESGVSEVSDNSQGQVSICTPGERCIRTKPTPHFSRTVVYMYSDVGDVWTSCLAKCISQESTYVESWPNTTSVWAGWSRLDIPVDRYGGVHSQLIVTSSALWFPSCHQASQQDNTY